MSHSVEVSLLVRQVLSGVPTGSTVHVARVRAAPRIQRRVPLDCSSAEIIGAARDLRAREGLPFWHALFLTGEANTTGLPLELLQAAMFHQERDVSSITSIQMNATAAQLIAELADSTSGRDSLALLSQVDLPDGSRRFIPMLDFTSKSTRPGSETTVRRCISAIGVRGRLASSARSYHFYGASLVSKEEQGQFWARALLFTPIVDERWIAHQMREGVGALRVSANEHGIVPRLLAEQSDSDGTTRS